MRNLLIPFLLIAVTAEAAPRVRATRPKAPAVTWAAPSCDVIRGLPSFRFTRDVGDSIAANEFAPTRNITPQAIATSDVPNRLFAIFDDAVFVSHDAGCNWEVRVRAGGLTTVTYAQLISARGGRAYAWNDSVLVRIENAAVTFERVPERFAMLAADPADADHLFGISIYGTPYESVDGGASWMQRTRAAQTIFYDGAVDPRDFRHVIITGMSRILETRDGGITWTALSIPERGNFMNIEFSPADASVVWISGVALDGVGPTIYRSEDNGATFTAVLRRSSLVGFGNSVPLAPHPTNRNLLAFAAWSGLATFDAASGTTRLAAVKKDWHAVVWSPSGEVIYLAGPDETVVIG